MEQAAEVAMFLCGAGRPEWLFAKGQS
jgi:hypothetical protein